MTRKEVLEIIAEVATEANKYSPCWNVQKAAWELLQMEDPDATDATQDRIAELEKDKARLLQPLMSLRNEARGFLSQANEQDHGYTNIQCLQNRIDDASRVIDTMKEGV